MWSLYRHCKHGFNAAKGDNDANENISDLRINWYFRIFWRREEKARRSASRLLHLTIRGSSLQWWRGTLPMNSSGNFELFCCYKSHQPERDQLGAKYSFFADRIWGTITKDRCCDRLTSAAARHGREIWFRENRKLTSPLLRHLHVILEKKSQAHKPASDYVHLFWFNQQFYLHLFKREKKKIIANRLTIRWTRQLLNKILADIQDVRTEHKRHSF